MIMLRISIIAVITILWVCYSNSEPVDADHLRLGNHGGDGSLSEVDVDPKILIASRRVSIPWWIRYLLQERKLSGHSNVNGKALKELASYGNMELLAAIKERLNTKNQLKKWWKPPKPTLPLPRPPQFLIEDNDYY